MPVIKNRNIFLWTLLLNKFLTSNNFFLPYSTVASSKKKQGEGGGDKKMDFVWEIEEYNLEKVAS